MNRSAIPTVSPAHYVAHALHREARAWPESNCYVDLWIEVLHALGLEPHAMLSHTMGVDFEGDQWTFFKPSLEDLRQLYGIQIEELQIWDELRSHVQNQLSLGRLVLAEVDAFHLPDTAGSSYRREHVKTTIAVERIDCERRRLGYFHNGGYWLLETDDFDGVFAVSRDMPPYAELAKLERAERLEDAELRRRAHALVRRDVGRRPPHNPIERYIEHFGEHASLLPAGNLERFHRYAFATLRQCGSAFELAARQVGWLDPVGLAATADDFDALAAGAKSSLLKLARAVQRDKPLDLVPLADVAPRWDAAFARLEAWVERRGAEAA